MNEFDSVISGELRARIGGVRSSGDGEHECLAVFDPSFRGFDGHFPGNPIVPGVCLIELARVFAEVASGRKLRCREVCQCRFRRPVSAGDAVRCRVRILRRDGAVAELRADIGADSGTACQMRLMVEEL